MNKSLPQAKKRFGQNFLSDQGIIAEIIAAINPKRGDRVLEIGPGCGALTVPLIEKIGKIYAVELDRDLVKDLKKQFADKIELFSADILNFNFREITESAQNLRLIGNLPYNISTPILFHFAKFADIISDIHVMLQKEVVERIVACPGDSEYSRLSVMIQYRFHCESILVIPPESFHPQPKVWSAFLRLIPRENKDLIAVEPFFSQIVKASFAMRRKMIRNTLKDFFSEKELEQLNFDPRLRPEDLSVADYVLLSQTLT